MDSDLAGLSGIVGFLLPAGIAAVNRERWKPQTKGIAAFLLCVVAATVTAWYEDALNWRDARAVFAIVFGSAIASYQLYWRPTTISDKIERATG